MTYTSTKPFLMVIYTSTFHLRLKLGIYHIRNTGNFSKNSCMAQAYNRMSKAYTTQKEGKMAKKPTKKKASKKTTKATATKKSC